MPNLPLIVANLLRQSAGDAEDAKLLLDRGRLRNGAKLARSACDLLIHALVATEQGRPSDDEVGPEQIPADNPLHHDLLQAFRLADAETRGSGSPQADRVQQSLEQTVAALAEAAQAFDVDLNGGGRAGNVQPIRPPKPPAPEPAPPPAKRIVERPRPNVTKRNVGRAPPPVPPSPPAAPVHPVQHRAPPVSRKRHDTFKVGAIVDHRPRSDGPRPPKRPEPHPKPATTPRAASAPLNTQARQPPREMPSTAFWSLMDQWHVADRDALQLIGHPGGLTGKGTRPRFRVKGSEADRLALLYEVQDRLQALGEAPTDWLARSMQAAPFGGASPVEHMSRHGEQGVRDVLRRLTQLSFSAAT